MKTVKIIPSKSDAHRAYIAAALARKDFKCVVCDETSEDIEATRRCLLALLAGEEDLYCGESGSTLRFLLPVVGALGVRGVFHPEGRLAERPMTPLVDELCSHGMQISIKGVDDLEHENTGSKNPKPNTVIIADGKLAPGTYRIPGNISSQFVSGLLFALPLLEGDSEIIIDGELESSPYVDMTIDTLSRFGMAVEDETTIRRQGIQRTFFVRGNQKYNAPDEYMVQGDWSNAAFWFAMGALGKEPIRVEGLSAGTFQADERIWDAIDVFGIEYEFGPNYVEVHPSRERMRGITWDASDSPDMVPVLALLGAFAKGETKILNAARLRMKESDRLHTVAETLKGLGARVEELPDGLVIRGSGRVNNCGGELETNCGWEKPQDTPREILLDSFGDHRIAMMIAAASVALAENEGAGCARGDSRIKLSGWQAVNKSYPSFFRRMGELGLDGNIELI